jgi:hypothetical protein
LENDTEHRGGGLKPVGEGGVHGGTAVFCTRPARRRSAVCQSCPFSLGIENSLHYVLDASLEEDGSRLGKDNGPENIAILRKVALTADHADTATKSGIIGRRKQMAWSNEYLEQLLFLPSSYSVLGNLYALFLMRQCDSFINTHLLFNITS